MLLMGRRLRTRLDLLTPSVEKYVEGLQYSTMFRRTAHCGFFQFNVGDPVLARSYGKGGKWVHGVVSEVIGSRHYIVNVSGNLWKRLVDQLFRCCVEVVPTNDSPVDPPGEIAADPTFPVPPVPPTAVPDEPRLTGEDSHLGKPSLTESELYYWHCCDYSTRDVYACPCWWHPFSSTEFFKWKTLSNPVNSEASSSQRCMPGAWKTSWHHTQRNQNAH